MASKGLQKDRQKERCSKDAITRVDIGSPEKDTTHPFATPTVPYELDFKSYDGFVL